MTALFNTQIFFKLNLKEKLILWLIPAILGATGITLLQYLLPIHSGYPGLDQDPAYQYYLNGLALFDLQAPMHVDHPGTPLQIIAGVITSIVWTIKTVFGHEIVGLIQSGLNDPEYYIAWICPILLICNVMATYYFGLKVFQSSSKIYLALICQITSFLFWPLLPRSIYLAPESLLVVISYWYLGLLSPLIFKLSNKNTDGNPPSTMMLGLVGGLGLAVKFNFAPLLLLLLFLEKPAKIVKAALLSVVFFLIFVSPALVRYEQIANWVLSLFMHSGVYGSGKPSIIDPILVLGNLKQLIDNFFVIFVVCFLLLIVLIKRYFENIKNGKTLASELLTPLVLLVTISLEIALVAKHFGYHYLLPILPVVTISISWLLRNISLKIDSKLINRALPITCIGLSLFIALSSATKSTIDLAAKRMTANQSLSAIEKEIALHPNALIIGTYRCTLRKCALSFAGAYATLHDYLPQYLNNYLYYSIWWQKLVVYGSGWEDPTYLKPILASGTEVLLVSPEGNIGLDRFVLSPIVKTPLQTLYKIEALRN